MKLRSLEAFCAAVEERTISGAARRMYISQPSVSDRLAELEREAQVQLLKRSPQGVEPTEHGALLYKHARKALDEVRGVDHLLHKLRSKRDMQLHFAASSTLGEHLLPQWLWEYRRGMPEVAPRLFVGNTREVVEQVRSGEVGFGIIEGRQSQEGLECLPLLDDELVVVVSPGHRWARRQITVEDLPREPFISREKGSGTRGVIERSLEEMGVSLSVQSEIGSTSGIKEAIEAGFGFSMLSRATIRLEVEAGRLAVAEGVAIPRRFTLIRHSSPTLSLAERGFHEHLLEVRERSGMTLDPAEA